MIGYRVQETTLTTGTGTLELAGAIGTGFRSFRDEFADGAQVFYVIASVDDDGNGTYEIGLGTLTHGTPDTLTRDTVLRSSNGGAKVSWGPGPKMVLNDFPADAALMREAIGALGAADVIGIDGVSAAVDGSAVNVSLDIDGLTEDTAPDPGADFLAAHDTSGVAPKKVKPANLFPYILIRDEKPSGTAGGSSAVGWNTRVLNTEVVDTGNHAALASNQITLAAGTYEIEASAPAFQVGRHQLRLRNVTDGTTVLVGSSEQAVATDTIATRSFISGRFTIAAGKALELQHYAQAAKATDGLGAFSGSGEVEVFAVVTLRKVG